jgi:GDSL-like lipase/acylhydrolase family protein
MTGLDHVVLLGDSIFDNGAYTNGGPDVIGHLRSLLPEHWNATLCAVDGSRTTGLAAQLRGVPEDATRLVVAVGGNDALASIDLLSLRVASSAELLGTFAARIDAFETDYRRAIGQLVSLKRPATVCTIYDGALPATEARLARIGLMMFNDAILRTAFDERCDVIELRAICRDASDYANPIEPSAEGGRKIALAIAHALGVMNTPLRQSRVWAHY